MRPLPDMDPDALARLEAALAGEAVLWAGQPSARVAFWRAARIWLFALPWCAFAVFWEGMALSAFFAQSAREASGAAGVMAIVFPLLGLPFVGIGLWMLARPFLVARRARRSVHILTDKRLIRAELGRELRLTSLDPAQIKGMTREERPDGLGTLSLSLGMMPAMVPTGPDRPMLLEMQERVETIEGVPDVAGLEAALLTRRAD